jgi:hypothetical protein
VSVGTSVCVLNFHFRGHKVAPVPRWLKRLLFIKEIPKTATTQTPQIYQSSKPNHLNTNSSNILIIIIIMRNDFLSDQIRIMKWI